MAEFHRSQSFAWRALLLGALTVGAVGACGGDDKPSSDAGDDEDSSTPKDDAGDKDAGNKDAATGDAGNDAGKDAGKDAGPVDPAVPGNDKPTITQVGYYNDSLGLRILVDGRDKNGDVASYRMLLLKGGAPALVDPDGDGILPASSEWPPPGVPSDLVSSAGEAGFFMRIDPNLVFLEQVDQISVTVKDAMENVSEVKLSNKLSAAPTVSGACDPRGFNVCSGTNVCAPGTGTMYTCRTLSSVRMSACANPLVLQPPATTSVMGAVSLPSRWEAPAGCTNTIEDQADAVIKLRLSTPATAVLTVNGATTGFDSVLYVLGSTTQQCAMDTGPCGSPCLCEDGDGSPTGLRDAVLRLPNLSAGDYYIAVDLSPQPGNASSDFEVGVTLE